MNDMTLGTIIGAAITAVFTGIAMILNAIHKNRQESKTTQFTEQGVIIDRQEKQISRLEAQVLSQQSAIDIIQKQHGECREETAALRLYVTLLYDYAKRQHDSLCKAGIPSDAPPEMPKSWRQGDVVDFISRSTQQNTQLLTDQSNVHPTS